MYRIVDVTVETGDAVEPMGSKPKFWFELGEYGPCLFKAVRSGSGEDWAEKVAEQVASVLGLPHATYELATWKQGRGVVSPRMTSDGEQLIHGNELLINIVPDYETKSTNYRTPLHTVSAVCDALESRNAGMPRGWTPPDGIESCVDLFCGYLLLDALVGNTDRHHENWAVVEVPGRDTSSGSTFYMAPTFDHASSLGRNEPLDRVRERLRTKDDGFTVEAYARRAKSALYLDADDSGPLSPIEAFREAARITPAAAKVWCTRVARLDTGTFENLLDEVPRDRMAPEQKEFAVRFLSYNRRSITTLCESL